MKPIFLLLCVAIGLSACEAQLDVSSEPSVSAKQKAFDQHYTRPFTAGEKLDLYPVGFPREFGAVPTAFDGYSVKVIDSLSGTLSHECYLQKRVSFEVIGSDDKLVLAKVTEIDERDNSDLGLVPNGCLSLDEVVLPIVGARIMRSVYERKEKALRAQAEEHEKSLDESRKEKKSIAAFYEKIKGAARR